MFTSSRVSKTLLSWLERRLFGESDSSAWVLFCIISATGLIIWAFLAAWGCSQWATADKVQNISVCPSFIGNLSPLIVSIGFWLVSCLAWFSRQKSTTSIFYLLISGVLASGLLSSMGNDSGGRFFFVLLAWLAPFTLRFHKTLSENEPGPVDRALILAFYLLATLGSLPWIFLKPTSLKLYGLQDFMDVTTRGILILAILVALYLAIHDYRKMTNSAAKRRLRLVVFGTILGFPPIVLLSLIPNTLQMSNHVPYAYTFPILLLGPVLFAYSIYRFRLVWLEEIIRRGVAYYLLLVLLASLILYISNFLIQHRGSFDLSANNWIGIASFVLLPLLVISSWKAFHRLAYWALYGDRDQYSGLVERIAISLSTVIDPKGFCKVIYTELSNLWPISGCAIFMKDGIGNFCCVDSVGLNHQFLSERELPVDGALVRYLAASKEILETSQLLASIKRHGTSLQPEEMRLILSTDIALWIPLVSDHHPQGLVILGPWQPGSYLTTDDRRLLKSLIFQGGIAISNLYLDQEVLQRQQALDRAYHQLVFAREDERKRLARELHDQVIQPLVAHHYSVSRLKEGTDGNDLVQLNSIQKEISAIIRALRTLCSELRPPALDNLGLVGASKSLIDNFKKKMNIHILFNLCENREERLSDNVELCVFWVLQEALMNVQKHAKARQVEVSLRIAEEELDLIVEDDGKGFIPPDSLEYFVQQNHFGLAGLKERAQLIGGTVELYSVPGHGCQLFLQIPLTPANLQELDLS